MTQNVNNAAMDVIPFTGVGRIRLGMSKDEVCVRLGEPDSKAFDGEDETWCYSSGMLCHFASDDDGLLGSITLESEEFRIQGESIVGQSEERLCELEAAGVLPGLLVEEEVSELAARHYESDEMGLLVWVRDGRAANMTIFPRYDDSGNHPLWPDGGGTVGARARHRGSGRGGAAGT